MKNEKQKQIGRNIRALRKERGITQADLADKIGCTQAMIAQYEKGQGTPSAEKIPLIANALGAKTDDLFGIETINTGIRSPKLLKKFEQVEQLSPSDKRTVYKMIEGLAAQKNRLEKQA